MIEIEYKYKLDEIEYIKINRKLRFLNKIKSEQVLQINYYYDTEDFKLHRMNQTLRVRQKGKDLVLTYKYDKKKIREANKCTEQKLKVKYLPTSINMIINLKYYKLKFIGNLITQRTNYYFNKCIVSLDTSYYNGKVDYEMEIELNNGEVAFDKIEKILEVGYNLSLSTEGKYSRFVKSRRQ